jgi:hypothetical protein
MKHGRLLLAYVRLPGRSPMNSDCFGELLGRGCFFAHVWHPHGKYSFASDTIWENTVKLGEGSFIWEKSFKESQTCKMKGIPS